MKKKGFFCLFLCPFGVRLFTFLYLLLVVSLPSEWLTYPVRKAHFLLYWGWLPIDWLLLSLHGGRIRRSRVRVRQGLRLYFLTLLISFLLNALVYLLYEHLVYGAIWGPLIRALSLVSVYSLILLAQILLFSQLVLSRYPDPHLQPLSKIDQELAGFLLLPFVLTITLFFVSFSRVRDFHTTQLSRERLSLIEAVEKHMLSYGAYRAGEVHDGAFEKAGERKKILFDGSRCTILSSDNSRIVLSRSVPDLFSQVVRGGMLLYISDDLGHWLKVSEGGAAHVSFASAGSKRDVVESIFRSCGGVFSVVPFRFSHLKGYLVLPDSVVFSNSVQLLLALLLIFVPLMLVATVVFFVLHKSLLVEAGLLLEEVSEFVESSDFSRKLKIKGSPAIRELRKSINEFFNKLARLLRLYYDDSMEISALLSESIRSIDMVEKELSKPEGKRDKRFIREVLDSLKEAFENMLSQIDFSVSKFGSLKLPVQASEMHLTIPDNSSHENRD